MRARWEVDISCAEGPEQAAAGHLLAALGAQPAYARAASRRSLPPGGCRTRADAACHCVFDWQLLAMIGEQFSEPSEICGAVVSVRQKGDRISLWTRTASNEAVQARPAPSRLPAAASCFSDAPGLQAGHCSGICMLAHCSGPVWLTG